MISTYLLVEWTGEQKYSVVKRDAIVDTNFRTMEDDKLIGTDLKMLWNCKPYDANVIQCGIRIDMNHELKVLTNLKAAEARSQEPSAKVLAIDEILAEVTEPIQERVIESPGQIFSELEVEELKEKIEKEREKRKKLKEKYKSLKRKYQEVLAQEISVDIADGISIPKSQLDTILRVSDDPGKLARNLLRALFTEDELVNRSLFGRPCNANMFDPLPSIDPVRRDAIIDYVAKKFQMVPSSLGSKRNKNRELSALHGTMGDCLRYIRKLGKK